jgi:XTP/dITP diphosphohydrolase
MMNEKKKIILATGNPGKLKEFQQLLADRHIEIFPQSAFNVESAEETGLSFVENAILKARHASRISGLPAIADDSGLAVDALGGAPGIYSARYAGEKASDADNNQKLLMEMQHVPEKERTAQFICALVFVRHAEDPVPLICQGSWQGRILFAPQGKNGFGYDPLFWVKSEQCSSAALNKERKNQLSHRGQAMAELLKRL